jgi:hypothetical protein
MDLADAPGLELGLCQPLSRLQILKLGRRHEAGPVKQLQLPVLRTHCCGVPDPKLFSTVQGKNAKQITAKKFALVVQW